MGTAVFAGSFDPFTVGHADIVQRALRLFGKVIIAVGYNENKRYMLPTDRRIAAIASLYASDPRVEVCGYEGLTVDFVRRTGADFILRGSEA